MTPEEYDEQILENAKKSSLEQHNELILIWLYEYSEVTAAQIYEWLQEKYQKLYCIGFQDAAIRKSIQ